MANEKKVNEITENVVENVTSNNVETVETEEVKFNVALYVHREVAKDKFGKVIKTKSGEPLFNYFLPCVIRGRNSKVDFVTPDKGGFEPLNYVYNGADRAELFIMPYSFGEGANKNSGYKYEVRSTDEDGIVYRCEIKPARKSDISLLGTYMSILAHRAK